MAETIFAGKQVKEFSLKDCPALFRTFYTIFSWFPEYFLMGNRPGNTGYRDSQYKQP